MSARTRADLIARATRRLARAGVPEPERDARLLCRWAAGLDGAGLAAALGAPAAPAEMARLERAVAHRARRVPVSHITGKREFWGRTFEVGAQVLDPRPETETLVEAALAGPAPGRILDLGTGSGCILLTLLAAWQSARGTGTDISPAALAVAGRNAARLGVADRATLIRSDWFAGVADRFDLIVSNPPYLAEAEIDTLAPEVRLHEPRGALTAGGDGLDAYRRIADGLGRHLAPGGSVLMEIGPHQAEKITEILDSAGLRVTAILRDLAGRNRVISARIP